MKPCTGCGECCLSYKCELSTLAFGKSETICPFLRFVRPGFYRCKFIEMENFLGLDPLAKKALGIGLGCTNDFKNENQ